MVRKIIIIGGGGHAKSVIAALKKGAGFEIVGYVTPAAQGLILGVRWVGTDDDLKHIQKKFDCRAAVVGVGNVTISGLREQIFNRLLAAGYELPTIVSPSAVINEDVKVGPGTVVLDRAVINAGGRIGKGCILNTGCIIDHDCRIADLVHVAPGAVLSGGVKVGKRSLLGTGCRVIQDVTISADCLVGAGAVVVKNLKKPGIYAGVPARLVEKK